MSASPGLSFHEIIAPADLDVLAVLLVIAAPGFVAGVAALGSVLRERRARARRLAEARHLTGMLRLDGEAHSPALRGHYEARLDEVVDGFDISDCVRSPEAKEMVYAYFGRRGYLEDQP